MHEDRMLALVALVDAYQHGDVAARDRIYRLYIATPGPGAANRRSRHR